jgi:hypothetical protein
MDDLGRPLFQEAMTNATEEFKYHEFQHWGALPAEEPSSEEEIQAERYTHVSFEHVSDTFNSFFTFIILCLSN